MNATIKLDASELNMNFIESLKKLFENKYLEISINAINKPKEKIFYSSELLNAASDIKDNKNTKSFSLEEFKQYSSELLKQ